MPEFYSNYRSRISRRVRQMVTRPEYKILCPMRSGAKCVPVVPISSPRGTSYDQVVNTVNFARSRGMSLNPSATKSIVH